MRGFIVNYTIKELLVFGILSVTSLAFAMNDTKVDQNNNNNAPTNQKELTPNEYIQKQLDLLRKDSMSVSLIEVSGVIRFAWWIWAALRACLAAITQRIMP